MLSEVAKRTSADINNYALRLKTKRCG